MTMPSRLSCSPLLESEFLRLLVPFVIPMFPIERAYVLVCGGRRLVIDLHLGVVGDGADHLVGAGNDLVALLQPAESLRCRWRR